MLNLLYGPTVTSIHDYWKNHSFHYTGLCWQSNISAFNTLSRFVIAFLPRNKHLLILWLMSLSTVILKPPKIKSATVYIFSPFICQEAVKHLSTMRETWVRALGWEDPLEREMATHSSILAWKILWTEDPGRLCTVHGVAKSWTRLSDT